MVEVVVIGAGVSGLSCAAHLKRAGRKVVVYEASDGIGGRVRSDTVDGMILDRGFQVLLTAYPEAQRALDFTRLKLRPFVPGALVRFGGRWNRLVDPWRDPVKGVAGLLNPIGTVSDKMKVGWWRANVDCLDTLAPETSSLEALKGLGFSEKMIDRFFRPFMGGVFLETELATSARKLASTFRMFSLGDTAVPAQGMGQIPTQLAEPLGQDEIALGRRAMSIEGDALHLDGGERVRASSIVIATAEAESARLLSETPPPSGPRAHCLYFSAPRAPHSEPILALNGDGVGPINNLAVMSAVSSAYAPPGRSLISVTSLGDSDDGLREAVQAQLRDWYGAQVQSWEWLRTYSIPNAVPSQKTIRSVDVRVRDGLYRCGDYSGIASIDTALRSGRLAAQAILNESRS